MKSIKILAASILLASVLIFMYSCKSDELSRDTAEKLIKEKFHLPSDEITPFAISDQDGTAMFHEDEFKILESKGLLTYRKNVFFGLVSLYGKLTAKGKQYAVSGEYKGTNEHYNQGYINVKAATLTFGEITGILQNKESNTAKVDYTLLRKDVTPFGRIAFKLNEGTFNKSVTFTKYDDGWRIN
jgi:hypothetical protein